ncbi:MAG: HAD-IIA family hydrolase [Oscillospiraceae bacterium]|nr:HAD-IIA family hydrolase [Oscillospiraceae bacterium]
MPRHALFARTKYFIIDMDGTFYLSGRMLPGAGELVGSLAGLGLEYRFFSNNSSNSAALCREKLERMGFPVEEERILISSHVAADELRRRHPGAKVYLLGNERLEEDLRRAGIALTDSSPDLVLLGFDTTLSYEKIAKAARWLANGKPYYATHPDMNCPVEGGFVPDTGSMIELFAASTGRRPVVFGKPERPTVDFLLRRLNCRAEELVFIGDRLETDIAIGRRHGIPCVLVLSGVTTARACAESSVRADLTLPSLAALADYL